MKTFVVFDKEACCADGICGDKIDPLLVVLTAQLKWLKEQGINARRIVCSTKSRSIRQNASVKAALKERGAAALPLIVIDGRVVQSGSYPVSEQITSWLGRPASESSMFDSAAGALAGVAASVAANCGLGLSLQIAKAEKAGLPAGDIARAAEVGLLISAAKACDFC